MGSRLVESIGEAPLVLIASPDAPTERTGALEAAGADVIRCPGAGAEQVRAALTALGERGVRSLLVEGGATLAGSFRDAGEIDALDVYFGPLVIGGAEARPLIAGTGAASIAEAERGLDVSWRETGGGDMTSPRA